MMHFALESMRTKPGCRHADERLPEVESEVGIDLGLTAFAVLSDGTVVENPRLLRRAECKITRAQREVARKQKRIQQSTKGGS